MIPVTKPFFPPIEAYWSRLQGIWQREWITNHGPLVNELELALKDYLGINHLLFLSNGTVALQVAIKALELTGEIITTPYSYVATTSSIVWEGCTPVFVDIEPDTFNISPALIEQAITPRTTAILATHVYGNPCDVEAIEKIAVKHNLKVIYDAAHTFGVTVNGRSIFGYGDISTTSFHATKLFHTCEGGAVTTPDASLLRKMALLRNFGHTTPVTFEGIGINGKNSELHAAMGLCNMVYIDEIMKRRKEQYQYYTAKLTGFKGTMQSIHPGCTYNYAYFPLIMQTEAQLHALLEQLQAHQVIARRYFYPSLSTLGYVKPQPCPVAESVAARAVCLPLYHTLSREEQDMICRILLRVQNN